LGATNTTNPDRGVVKVDVIGVENPTIEVYSYLSNRPVYQEDPAFFNQAKRGGLAGTYHRETLN